MVTVENNRVHLGDRFSVSFQRTDRLAQELLTQRPVSRGVLPVRLTSSLLKTFDSEIGATTAVVVPCDDTEAVWLGFAGKNSRRVALKIRQGDVDAVTGAGWNEQLHEPQDYLIPPDQTSWYGVASRDGNGRQFSTAPVELVIFEPRNPVDQPQRTATWDTPFYDHDKDQSQPATRIFNVIPDPHGPAFWTSEPSERVTIHFVSSSRWKSLTGEDPPGRASGYNGALLP